MAGAGQDVGQQLALAVDQPLPQRGAAAALVFRPSLAMPAMPASIRSSHVTRTLLLLHLRVEARNPFSDLRFELPDLALP